MPQNITDFKGAGMFGSVADHANQVVNRVNNLDPESLPKVKENIFSAVRPTRCQIVATGPSGAADHTNEFYWIKPIQLIAADGADHTTALSVHDLFSTSAIYLAVNLSEIMSHGHNLSVDGSTIVDVYLNEVPSTATLGDLGSLPRYTFNAVGSSIPSPLVKYTVWSCTATNVAAWDKVRSGP